MGFLMKWVNSRRSQSAARQGLQPPLTLAAVRTIASGTPGSGLGFGHGPSPSLLLSCQPRRPLHFLLLLPSLVTLPFPGCPPPHGLPFLTLIPASCRPFPMCPGFSLRLLLSCRGLSCQQPLDRGCEASALWPYVRQLSTDLHVLSPFPVLLGSPSSDHSFSPPIKPSRPGTSSQTQVAYWLQEAGPAVTSSGQEEVLLVPPSFLPSGLCLPFTLVAVQNLFSEMH